MTIPRITLSAALCLLASLSAAGEFSGAETAFINKLSQTNSDPGQIWEGYRIDKPLLIYFERTGISVLMNASTPPQDFKPVKLPDIHANSIYLRSGGFKAPKDHYNWSLKEGGERVIFWKMAPTADIEEETYTLYHEYFHHFQNAVFVKEPEFPLPPKELSAETVSRYYLEDILLMRALLAAGNERAEEVKDFVCVRDERYKNENANVIGYEAFKERVEGSAEYAGLRAILNPAVKAVDAGGMLVPLIMRRHSFGLFFYSANDSDIRFYSSGPSQMALLDGIRTKWEHRLEKGESIYSILREYFRANDCGTRIRRLKEVYDFTGLLNTAKANAAALNTFEAEQSGAAADPVKEQRVIIKLPLGIGAKPPQTYNSPVKIDENTTLYGAAELNMHGGNIRLSVDKLALIYAYETKNVKGSTLFTGSRYEILLKDLSDLQMLIDGNPGSEKRNFTRTFKKLTLRNLRLDLNAERPGKITKTPDSITVEFD